MSTLLCAVLAVTMVASVCAHAPTHTVQMDAEAMGEFTEEVLAVDGGVDVLALQAAIAEAVTEESLPQEDGPVSPVAPPARSFTAGQTLALAPVVAGFPAPRLNSMYTVMGRVETECTLGARARRLLQGLDSHAPPTHGVVV